MKRYWYRLKNACRWFNQAWHLPRRLPYEFNWKGGHQHLCVALRLLHYKTFKEICPIAQDKNPDLEFSDACDYCPFMTRVDEAFDHNIEIHFSTGVNSNEQVISQNSELQYKE